MKIQMAAKKAIDVLMAATLLLLLSPLLLLVLAFILILEGAPLFYRSSRFVKPDKSIKILKFRSMVKDAKSEKYRLQERFMRDGYLDIPISCEVYTGIGRWLERTQLVEVPQLWSILVDGMSFVGNRPLPYENLLELQKFEHWKNRFDSPAGISGIAQVVGKHSLQPTERLELESTYSLVYHHGNILKCDFMIAIYTLRIIFLGSGIPYLKGRQLLLDCLPADFNHT
ncbi:MAG: sugar transferase [Bdellovibrionaceae bacterium]|nr:sugar transferase [Bdellovibrio sp.]